MDPPVDRDARRLVGHYDLSLNEQDMVRRVLAQVKVTVPTIDVQNVYGALCRFKWVEAHAVDFLERDGQPGEEPDNMDLGEAVSHLVEEHEYPISQYPYDDVANYINALAILMRFINHLKDIVGGRAVDDLSVKLFTVLVGASRPAATDRAHQVTLEARDTLRNKNKRFQAYGARPCWRTFHFSNRSLSFSST